MKQTITVTFTKDEFNYIHSAINNMAINYKEWAEDEIEDKAVFNDFIESYRNCRVLYNRLCKETYDESVDVRKSETFVYPGYNR